MKRANSILESFKYFRQISSYTVGSFLTQCSSGPHVTSWKHRSVAHTDPILCQISTGTTLHSSDDVLANSDARKMTKSLKSDIRVLTVQNSCFKLLVTVWAAYTVANDRVSPWLTTSRKSYVGNDDITPITSASLVNGGRKLRQSQLRTNVVANRSALFRRGDEAEY